MSWRVVAVPRYAMMVGTRKKYQRVLRQGEGSALFLFGQPQSRGGCPGKLAGPGSASYGETPPLPRYSMTTSRYTSR